MKGEGEGKNNEEKGIFMKEVWESKKLILEFDWVFFLEIQSNVRNIILWLKKIYRYC